MLDSPRESDGRIRALAVTHAGRRETHGLHHSQRGRSFATLCWTDKRRAGATRMAQSRSVRAHFVSSSMVNTLLTSNLDQAAGLVRTHDRGPRSVRPGVRESFDCRTLAPSSPLAELAARMKLQPWQREREVITTTEVRRCEGRGRAQMPPILPHGYSSRSASTGVTLDARSAGISDAASAVASKMAAAASSVRGSPGAMP